MCITSGATLATKCLSLSHAQRDNHFLEIVKSCSGHPKTCKSIKNRKSKIFTKPMPFAIYRKNVQNPIILNRV